MEQEQINSVYRKLSEYEAQPKTLTAKLMRLLPVIEQLVVDGHGYEEITVFLHKAGLQFNDASFKTSLRRAREKYVKLQANRPQKLVPLENRTENPLPSHLLAGSSGSVVVRPAATRPVAAQPKPANERGLSNEDLASLLVSSAREKPEGREFRFSSTPVPKDQRRG